ncbi:MAG: hypothetical protein JSU92_01480 [Deltaproteobacteria bacterium]|nr:MAG: hypothetical protein JSU92_01480 [Deltaproteobacteria bacterium]
MKSTTRIIIFIAVALPLLAVAFYIRYRPELEDRLLPPIIDIKSPLNGSILKDTKVTVEICCERIRTKGYSLAVNLNGNRINHKLGIKRGCFSGKVKCNSGYNLLNVELYRECIPSRADCRPRLLSHEISRFTVAPVKPASREKMITKPPSGQEPPSAPDGEDVELSPEEVAVSEAELTVSEASPAPGEDARTEDEDEEIGGLLAQDRDQTGEDDDEPPEPLPEEEAEPELVELFVTIERPIDGDLVNQREQIVSGDANPLMQVTYSNPRNGDLRITTATENGKYFFPLVPFNEGMDQIFVTVNDTEGRTASASCNLLVDTIPPLVRIDKPKDTSIHSTLRIDVHGSTEPNILVEIVEPYSSTRSDGLGKFDFPQVTFREGMNSLTIRATDAAGNVGTITVNFKIDITRPEISCDDGLQCTRNFGLSGRTESNSTVLWPDQDLQTTSDAEGNFTFPYVLFPEGENNIQLRAIDPAGNSFDTVCFFVIDTTPPVVNLTNPQNGGIINPRTEDVTGITEPFCPVVELFVHGTEERREAGSDNNGHFVFPGIAFPEGPNTLTVEATDRCGWEGASTINFFAEPDFYRVTIDYCDALENPIDFPEVTQFDECVYVNLPDEGRSLGAYHLFISYDPEVIQLQRVAGGDAIEFNTVSARINNIPDPDTGLATSFFFEANNGRTNWTAPSGMDINVAKLTFDVIDPGISTLALRIKTLSDNNRQPISGFALNGFVEIR